MFFFVCRKGSLATSFADENDMAGSDDALDSSDSDGNDDVDSLSESEDGTGFCLPFMSISFFSFFHSFIHSFFLSFFLSFILSFFLSFILSFILSSFLCCLCNRLIYLGNLSFSGRLQGLKKYIKPPLLVFHV